MEKCRICMKFRKRMHSLYDSMEEDLGITYADMMASISNVKVTKIDGIPNEACLACCKRLRDIYEFRCLIERSDIELQEICQTKRILFTNIQDIKCKIKLENVNKVTKQHDNITEQFIQSCEKSLNYNNIIINRLGSPDEDDKKTLTAKGFLESMKEDPDNEYDIVYDIPVEFDSESDNRSDEDYTPIKKYKYDKNKRSLANADESLNYISIKPVYLKDIRVARTKFAHKNRKTLHTKKYVCIHCGKMVASLKSHMLTHTGERNVKCDKCPKSFHTRERLNKHQQSHANKDYKCDKCVASYTTKKYLEQHQLKHTGQDKNFSCEICGKKFQSKGHLRRHCQGIHNMASKNFGCEQCSMSFLTKSYLNHHMRVHTGERPYRCEICSQPYSYKRDFTRHCLNKHGVFLKGRQVFVMNEEVLVQERALMRDLMLRVNRVITDDKPINPFKGPHAVKAFEQAVKALETKQIQIDLTYVKN